MSDDNDTSFNDSNAWHYYWYNPSLAGAIIFIVIFLASTVLMTYQSIKTIIFIKKNNIYKSRKSRKLHQASSEDVEKVDSEEKDQYYGSYRYILILIPFNLGLLCEFIGYIGRTINHNNIWSRGPYIMQTLLLLIAPPLFSATLYMTFGRLVTNVLHNEKKLLLYPKYITKFCVVGDILSLLLQAAGGGIMSGTSSNPDNFTLGENVILGGLGVQILFFGFFMVIEATYYFRLHKAINKTEYNSKVINTDIRSFPNRFNNWRTILISLFVCSIFILIRSIYRVIEFTEGNNGYIARHEWFLYIFDSLMMFLNAFFFLSQDVSNYFLRTIPLTLGGESELLTNRIDHEERADETIDDRSYERSIENIRY